MGQSKEQWISETGGMRIESAELTATRRRVLELAHKLQSDKLTVEERDEFMRLSESLPNDS